MYDIANYRIPDGVYWWMAEFLQALDEVILVSQAVLYLIVGGVFAQPAGGPTLVSTGIARPAP